MNELEQAIAALRAGKREEARKLLAAVLRQDKDNLRAWQWMYNAAESDGEKKYCLKEILRLDPGNLKAAQMLEQLSGIVTFDQPRNPQPARQETKKSSNTTLILIGLVLLAAACCCLIFMFSSFGNELSRNAEVKYVVTGTAKSAFITYFNEQGGTEQVNVNLPFEKSWVAKEASSLSIVAQNDGSGTITCEIWFRGEKIKTSTSTAQYGIVTCADFIFP